MSRRIFEVDEQPSPERAKHTAAKWGARLVLIAIVLLIALVVLAYYLVLPRLSQAELLPEEVIALRGLLSGITGLVILVIGAAFYFLPLLVAAGRKHRNVAAILVINMFLGWTFLGWVGAFVWAVIETKPER